MGTNYVTKHYPAPIERAVKVMCDELKKDYPQLFERLYDDHGFPDNNSKSTFQDRMIFGLYVELIKAGVIK